KKCSRSDQSDRQQVRLWNSQTRAAAAQHRVVVVSRGIERHDKVVPIIAAKEKDADQRLVIGNGMAVGVEQPKTAENRAQSQSPYGLASTFDEFPARGSHVSSDQWTIWYCELVRTR